MFWNKHHKNIQILFSHDHRYFLFIVISEWIFVPFQVDDPANQTRQLMKKANHLATKIPTNFLFLIFFLKSAKLMPMELKIFAEKNT